MSAEDIKNSVHRNFAAETYALSADILNDIFSVLSVLNSGRINMVCYGDKLDIGLTPSDGEYTAEIDYIIVAPKPEESYFVTVAEANYNFDVLSLEDKNEVLYWLQNEWFTYQ